MRLYFRKGIFNFLVDFHVYWLKKQECGEYSKLIRKYFPIYQRIHLRLGEAMWPSLYWTLMTMHPSLPWTMKPLSVKMLSLVRWEVWVNFFFVWKCLEASSSGVAETFQFKITHNLHVSAKLACWCVAQTNIKRTFKF